jgi:hypothetical protein
MKHIRLLSTLTLIALALLLCAESPSPTMSPVPRSRNAERQSEARNLAPQQCPQLPSPVNFTGGAHTPNPLTEPQHEQGYGYTMSNAVMVAATVVMAFATVSMAWFNFLLVGISKEMKATAEAALHLNRPEMVVTFVDTQLGVHQRTGTPDTLIGYLPQIYNLGSGPAEITGMFAHTMVFDAFDKGSNIPFVPAQEPRASDLIWDAYSSRVDFPHAILAPRECIANYSAGFFPVTNWIVGDIEAVEAGERRRAIYGLIRYRSSVKEDWTRFFYWWDPGRRAFRRAELPELNERI